MSTQCAIKTIRKNYPDNQHPITVGACDNGAIYDFEDLNKIINHEDCDIVVWAISPDANMLLKPVCIAGSIKKMASFHRYWLKIHL